LVSVGDLVIIVSFVDVEGTELAAHEPSVVFVDSDNRQIEAD
jgi:aspartate 1-decarboxylase